MPVPHRIKTPKPDLYLERMFETRSEAWDAVGLHVSEASEKTIRRAQRQSLVLIPLLIGLLVAYDHRARILGWSTKHHAHHSLQTPLQIGVVIALCLIGWALARDVGRAVGPTFFRRMDPATAGTVGFLVRLVTIAITLFVALHVVGVRTQTLAVGGAFTAVILGLAAQQTLGNVFAGMVLLTARPFRVGERVRLQAGVVGGTIEGRVSALGLLYTTLVTHGSDRMMVPNNVVLAAAIVPLKVPDPVDVKVRLSSGVPITQVQAILDNEVATPTTTRATVHLEEIDGDEVVVRIHATPEFSSDGAKLADEIIAALASVTGEHKRVSADMDDQSKDREPSTGDEAGVRSDQLESPGDTASFRTAPTRVRE